MLEMPVAYGAVAERALEVDVTRNLARAPVVGVGRPAHSGERHHRIVVLLDIDLAHVLAWTEHEPQLQPAGLALHVPDASPRRELA